MPSEKSSSGMDNALLWSEPVDPLFARAFGEKTPWLSYFMYVTPAAGSKETESSKNRAGESATIAR